MATLREIKMDELEYTYKFLELYQQYEDIPEYLCIKIKIPTQNQYEEKKEVVQDPPPKPDNYRFPRHHGFNKVNSVEKTIYFQHKIKIPYDPRFKTDTKAYLAELIEKVKKNIQPLMTEKLIQKFRLVSNLYLKSYCS